MHPTTRVYERYMDNWDIKKSPPPPQNISKYVSNVDQLMVDGGILGGRVTVCSWSFETSLLCAII